ncbi:hypothetical protein MIND_00202300 [Mycena indigotica]|uniref:Uncharacterized protein n=1 Tax=Mycena indigotica TaxID=2126181 RepID=A0A8H6WAT3_9AGAR|nr:uncharacterized protein MIND_00202300 [Mycena indigotica]KAF7311909.1 hypothetical protein MIND_00202300 [Mycena indigotica]
MSGASTAMPMPNGMTHASLLAAKSAELKFWILQTNEMQGKKALKVTGKVEDLRQRLATYYGLDLTVTSQTATTHTPAPLTLDQHIIARQWEGLAEMGQEWLNTTAEGREFRLVRDVGALALQDGPLDPPSSSRSPTPVLLRISSPPLGARADTQIITSPSPLPVQPPQPPQQHLDSELHGLSSLAEAIEGLNRVQGLKDSVAQIKSGLVASVRRRYGPKDKLVDERDNSESEDSDADGVHSSKKRRGRGADPSWEKHKGTLTKRERLGGILYGKQDFDGDEARFFKYFKMPHDSEAGVETKRKRVPKNDDGYRPFRRVVEAYPWCKKDIQAERNKSELLK